MSNFFMRKNYLRLCPVIVLLEKTEIKSVESKERAHPLLIPLDENLEESTPRGECGCTFR